MQTSYVPQISYIYLKLSKYSTKQLQKLKASLWYSRYTSTFSNLKFFFLCVIKIFLNKNEVHVAKAEKLPARMNSQWEYICVFFVW